MDRDKIVAILNSFIENPAYLTAYSVLYEYLKDKDIDNLKELINAILRVPLISTECVNYASKELCAKYNILILSKDNKVILFY